MNVCINLFPNCSLVENDTLESGDPATGAQTKVSGLKDAEEETSLNKDHACGSAGVALRCALRKLRRASAATSLVELC